MQHVTIQRNGEPIQLPLELNIEVDQKEVFVIDSHSLEQQMDQQLGWTLRNIRLAEGSLEQAEICRRYLRQFANYFPTKNQVDELIAANFKPHNDPVCMQYVTTADLISDLGVIYQLMYFHYFLGRKESIKNSFPDYCCGIASRNLTLSLWAAGIVAAVSTYNESLDHAYTIVPFVIAETGQAGVILADPTSDQLHDRPSQRVRNYLAVLPPEGWKYQTDWQRGSNLYPEIVQVSSCFGASEKRYHEYIKNAFRRPAVVV